MKKIDAFNHFFPSRLWAKMLESEYAGKGIGKRMRGVPCIYDLDVRFRVMDEFDDYTQILSLGMPPLEALGTAEETLEYAKLGNDGLAELVDTYPDRFAGYVASLPMNAPDLAAREAERVLTEGKANGVQIHTNVNGSALDHPEFEAVFETCARLGKPVLLHPARTAAMADYADEDKSRYEIWWTFGWPYETSVAMAVSFSPGSWTVIRICACWRTTLERWCLFLRDASDRVGIN